MRLLQLLFLLLPLLCLEGCGPTEGEDRPEIKGRLAEVAIDDETGYAYVRIRQRTNQRAKVALGAGDSPPRFVGMVERKSEEYQRALARTAERKTRYASAMDGAFDPSSGCTYRIESRMGGITKRKGRHLSGALVGSVPVPEGTGSLRRSGGCILTDPSKGFLYVGTARGPDAPAQVVKIYPGKGAEPPRLVGSILLQAGESNLLCGVIDPEHGYAYFGARSGVVKVALGDGEEPPTRVGALVLSDDERAPKHAASDASRGYAYFSNARAIVKVALGESAEPPVRVGVVRATTRDAFRQIWYLAGFLLLAAIPFALSLLFSVPLSRAFIACRDHSTDQLPSGQGGDPRATVPRALWGRLRWWILFWIGAAVLILYLGYPGGHGRGGGVVKAVGPLVRFAHAAAFLLWFYGPLPYMVAVCLLRAPRSARSRSLFLWTHFGGWAAFILACAAVAVGLGTVLQRLDFALQPVAYNPGFPDPEATLTYAALLGVAIACFCWFRFRRRTHLGSAKRGCST